MCEDAIAKLFQCLDENLREPTGWWPSNEFEERVMARWTVYELIDQLLDRPYDDPFLIVQEFMLDMMRLACQTRYENKRRTFEIACSTAEDVLTIL